eukprot:TRINITY_DN9434_c0_g1::TRINITY_DN9434_c0_g1_i1::g.277::m.277 TRINITY_DN9434_c0_g1::TRINITY_DN9434_c0_g1_i1::g.277  ORF type:complete len:270 (+),score=24.07,sp/Q6NRI8/CENPS_XENLA/33.33/2e-07,CENP-S/PF15630.1/9.5e-19,Histone/PF00125.19/1.2e-05,Bromo_TP/PF07524.8/0.00015,Bromo_TP/PF07524.8/1e+04,CDC27/PF09507.5/0.00022,CBFD_NFYB_HMF/PF00808.18/0.00022,CBFD_NFYB_HMF/PF00808.18/1.1e+03,CBFD_NFYB_HMF/PF00808.18/1.1e+04,CBFD_NFYB_HMF/PF00808.18/8.4e+03,TFIID-31kDa/PF02291.10/0.0019,CENP-T/PF15511.1/0.0
MDPPTSRPVKTAKSAPRLSTNRAEATAAILYGVSRIVSEQEQTLGVSVSRDATLGLGEMAVSFLEQIGRDSESFARHAKRSTVNVDDIKLCARNNEDVSTKLTRFASQFSTKASASASSSSASTSVTSSSTATTPSTTTTTSIMGALSLSSKGTTSSSSSSSANKKKRKAPSTIPEKDSENDRGGENQPNSVSRGSKSGPKRQQTDQSFELLDSDNDGRMADSSSTRTSTTSASASRRKRTVISDDDDDDDDDDVDMIVPRLPDLGPII